MTNAYEKLWQEQHRMLEQWMKAAQSVFQVPTEKPAWKKDGKTAGEDPETSPSVADWSEFFTRSYQQWLEARQGMVQQWWKNAPVATPFAAGWNYSKAWKEGLKQWGDWIEQSGNYWPYNRITSPAGEREWILRAASEWLAGWYKFWKPRTDFLEKVGLDPEFINKCFSSTACRQIMEQLFPLMPYGNWSGMMKKVDEVLDNHISFLQDIDLPFDEIAAFWDRLLMRFLPVEEAPLFRVGSDLHQNLEKMVNPFYNIAGPPKVMQWWKLWQNVQFHTAAFLVKNAQLRGKILEASVAVLPETLKTLNEELEQRQEMVMPEEFSHAYTTHLETHLDALLRSDEYSKIQSEVAQAGITLKAKIDELVELSVSGLPLITRTDEDDLAQELEALRVKVRRLERAARTRPKKEDKLSEQLN